MVVSKPVQSVNHEEETRIHSQTTEAAAVAAELQKLLVEPRQDDHRADAARLDQVRRILAQQVLAGDLEFNNSFLPVVVYLTYTDILAICFSLFCGSVGYLQSF
jgi:hypothetical protein